MLEPFEVQTKSSWQIPAETVSDQVGLGVDELVRG